MADDPTASPTRLPDPAPSGGRSRRAYVDLFLISFLILFFELTCIRWFGSTIIFLTFFTNIVLLACFLGMSVGCLAAGRGRDLVAAVIPLMLASTASAFAVLWAYHRFGQVMIAVGDQQSANQIFFGTEARSRDLSRVVVPIEVIAGFFFTLIALMFVGLGQVLGRAFAAIEHRVAAYAVNIAGSLAGIVGFAAASYLRTPPPAWFALSAGLCLYFVPGRKSLQVLCLGAMIASRALLGYLGYEGAEVTWSPYYKVQHYPDSGLISVNNIGHQYMIPVGDAGPAYALPHLLNRDAGRPPFRDVLIIGAGSGNDVQAALAYGAEHVDAVEIDPVMYEIGRDHHPGRPYDDPRVTVHLDDGRSVLSRPGKRYDLVVYALVDSLVLHSGYSSLRLESYLFTEQAFRDVRSRLKPGGTFAMYNLYRRGWVVARLEEMARRAFGTEVLTMALPYQPRITPEDRQSDRFTFLMVGNPGSPVEAIRGRFERDRSFWLNERPRLNGTVNGFGPRPPDLPGASPGDWQKVGPAEVETRGIGPLPTDDWPFLYLLAPAIPALNARGMAVVAALSLAILLAFAPPRAAGGRPRFGINPHMFFLGAGFMLLETKGVVHMALLFGSTWVVNSVVFAAVLSMILLSNLYVLAVGPRRLWPYYTLLLASLLANALVPISTFLALAGTARVVVSCAVVFVPIFFAGVIFATSFRASRRPDLDIGSNIGGLILGGLAENLSLIIGLNALLLVALLFYGLSAVSGSGASRLVPDPAPAP